MAPLWWKKTLNFASWLLMEGKLTISSVVHGAPGFLLRSRTLAPLRSHTLTPRIHLWGFRGREPLSLFSDSTHLLPCLPRALTLLTASARPCGTLLESLKMPCPRFPTQTVESVCVESGFRNACKPTWAVLAEGPVRRRPPMSMRCVTACELLDISECYW